MLKPGGLLVTSTDFFETPTDTRGQHAYGVPVHVFDKTEFLAAVATAQERGLKLTGPLDLSSNERVVRWDQYGLDYTFAVFVNDQGVNGDVARDHHVGLDEMADRCGLCHHCARTAVLCGGTRSGGRGRSRGCISPIRTRRRGRRRRCRQGFQTSGRSVSRIGRRRRCALWRSTSAESSRGS